MGIHPGAELGGSCLCHIIRNFRLQCAAFSQLQILDLVRVSWVLDHFATDSTLQDKEHNYHGYPHYV